MNTAKIFEEIKKMDAKTLIEEVKNNYNLTPGQEGLYILQIMQQEGYTRHKEVADVLGVSRAFVSLRIKAAKEAYGDIALSRSAGRPKHLIIELDELYGDKVPLRLISKVGEIPDSELIRMLMTHVVNLGIENKEDFFNEIIQDIVDTGEYTKEEVINDLEKVLDKLKEEQ